MSRWLWALLGGVVLVAIAALFWTAGNQTNVTSPVSPGPTAVAPAPVPAPPAPAPVAQEPAPSPPPAPAPPAAQEAAAPPAPSPTAPPAPTPAPDAGQQAASPPAAAPSSETPPAPAVAAQEPLPSPPPAEAPLPPPAPGRETQEVAGRIRAQEPRAVSRDLGLFHGGLRTAVRAARRRLGLSPAGGQVRPGRDCRVRRRRSFCLPPPAGSRARLKRKARSR